MSIGWIRIDTAIADDPAIARMADALHVRRPEVVGLVVGVLAKMAAHAQNGDLSPVPDSLLEPWSGWTGKRGRFAAMFRAEFCDAGGVVRAWDKLNGQPIREAEADAARKRRERAAQAEQRQREHEAKYPAADRPTDAPADKRVDVREKSPATDVTDVTNETSTTKEKNSADDRRPLKYGWVAPIRDGHEKIYGAGTFTKRLEGQFAGSWGELVKVHGGEKCARVWSFSQTSASEKERPFRTPEYVAAHWADFDPDAPAFPAEKKSTPEQQRWLDDAMRDHRKEYPELYNADGSRKEGTITNVPAATIAAPIDDTECPPSFKPWVRPVKLEDAA